MRFMLLGIVCAALAACAGSPSAQQQASPPAGTKGGPVSTTLVEDFDHGPPRLQFQGSVDAWSPRITSSHSTVDIVDDPSGHGKAVRFSFDASFDEPYSWEAWKDSSLGFISRIEMEKPAADANGLSIRMKPEGCTLVDLYLVQEAPGGAATFLVPLSANDGEWKQWVIPFDSFTPADPGSAFDAKRPFRIEAYVPFQENWQAFRFRDLVGARCALSFDDIGLWRSTTEENPRLLEGFDDERDAMPFLVKLEGSSTWMDYSTSDAGVARINTGVTAQELRLSRLKDGPEGEYLRISGRLALDPSIAQFHAAGQSLVLFVTARVDKSIAGSNGVSFLVQSDIARSGYIELQDEARDLSFGADFSVIGSWTRVAIPFDALKMDELALPSARSFTDRPRLQIAFELPQGDVERAAAKGVLEFSISLDGFRLEP